MYTIEIVDKLYQDSIDRFESENITNITPYKGDSLSILPIIIDQIPKDEGAVYFIDAHQSGPDTSFNQKQQVPLIEELQILIEKNISPAIYIFDDVRFWKGHEQQAWDWEHITEDFIINMFEGKNIGVIDYYVKNDRFFVMTV